MTIRSDMILRQIAKRHINTNDAFYLEVNNGPTWFNNNLMRLDAVAFKKSWKNPCITGYEVKVSRQDFKNDTKWPAYRKYCHRFYFACPAGLIGIDEIPDSVGLIYYNPERDYIITKKTALLGDIDIPWEMLYYLVVSRDEKQKHPFFSSKRDYFEALRVDKKERQKLGYWVSKEIGETINDLSKKLNTAEKELMCNQKQIKELEQVKQVLYKHGINTYWNMATNLQKALEQNMPPILVDSLVAIEKEVKRLINYVSREK